MVRSTEHTCKECDKKYASYQSLCNHRSKKHLGVDNSIEQHLPQHTTALNSIQNQHFTCRKCNKLYKHQQSRSRHEKICNLNNNITTSKNHPNNIQTIDNSVTNNTTNNTNNATNMQINNGTTNNGTINAIVINNFNEDNFYGFMKFLKKFHKYP